MDPDQGLPDQFKQRGAPRTAVLRTAQMRSQHWYSVEVKVCDVSSSGFKAECPEPVLIGTYVSLDVPGLGPVSAQVRWQLGGRIGGQFLDPISLNRCEWTAIKVDPPEPATAA
jgi:hypothetical protein